MSDPALFLSQGLSFCPVICIVVQRAEAVALDYFSTDRRDDKCLSINAARAQDPEELREAI